MKYPALKAAADAERKKQELVQKISELKDNKIGKMELLSMSIATLNLLVPAEKPAKPKKSVPTG